MAYIINQEKCEKDDHCLETCPVEAVEKKTIVLSSSKSTTAPIAEHASQCRRGSCSFDGIICREPTTRDHMPL